LGQQQLLLIVLGVIVVGLAVIVGINVFRANAIDQKRDSVMMECITLASLAQEYYLKPSAYMGGSGSYMNFTIPPSLVRTASGRYEITNQTQSSLTILGTGNEVVTGNDSIKVQVEVPNPPVNFVVTFLN
jgi:hypothetical protein